MADNIQMWEVLAALERLDELDGKVPDSTLSTARHIQAKREQAPSDVINDVSGAIGEFEDIASSSNGEEFAANLWQAVKLLGKVGLGLLIAPDKWTAFFFLLWKHNEEIREIVIAFRAL